MPLPLPLPRGSNSRPTCLSLSGGREVVKHGSSHCLIGVLSIRQLWFASELINRCCSVRSDCTRNRRDRRFFIQREGFAGSKCPTRKLDHHLHAPFPRVLHDSWRATTRGRMQGLAPAAHSVVCVVWVRSPRISCPARLSLDRLKGWKGLEEGRQEPFGDGPQWLP